jgi:putative N6-adenine-specific DNA methylase
MPRLIVTCPEETKSVLVDELKALGVSATYPAYRAVHCEATERQAYEAHLKLRTASRVLSVIKEVPCRSAEMLFSQARRIPWHELFAPERTFLVEGVPADRGAEFMRANDISKKVREGLQDSFQRHLGKAPKVDLQEPKVVIVAYVANGRCMLSFDTSGKALHKRGYRGDGHPAPVKETLAAALLAMAGYDGTQAFLDPMCGSGTIAIEAAMVALHKAPQIHRPKGQFLFEWLKTFDRDLWRETQEAVRGERLEAPPQPVAASDISEPFVELARKNALRARVEKHIQFSTARIQDAVPPAPTGVLVTNLPYGERLAKGATEDLKQLYSEIGDTLKQKFKGWRAALLAAEDSPHKFIGLKPSRRIPVLNGSIPCRLLIFDLYEGSRRPRPPASPAAGAVGPAE